MNSSKELLRTISNKINFKDLLEIFGALVENYKSRAKINKMANIKIRRLRYGRKLEILRNFQD